MVPPNSYFFHSYLLSITKPSSGISSSTSTSNARVQFLRPSILVLSKKPPSYISCQLSNSMTPPSYLAAHLLSHFQKPSPSSPHISGDPPLQPHKVRRSQQKPHADLDSSSPTPANVTLLLLFLIHAHSQDIPDPVQPSHAKQTASPSRYFALERTEPLSILQIISNPFSSSLCNSPSQLVFTPSPTVSQAPFSTIYGYLKDQVKWQVSIKELERLREEQPKIRGAIFASNQAQI